MRRATVAAVSVAMFACSSPLALAAPAHRTVRAPVVSAVPLPDLEIPFTKVVLKNGLTLIVHEDHKAPIVAVNIWYHVGSKNETPGRTGFAHLFEHLMFGGKGGNQRSWFERMEAIGATDLNGTTYYDRTNFFETVPTPALDMTLYLEAQRMGHLLDTFTEATLNTQRGVVQNEKRQDENEPYAVSDEIITKTVWPAAHPYSHTVIGEMTDLDNAKVDDVKDWVGKFYGPTNATVVLAGDITPAEAQAKVEQYFGALPPGPPVARQTEWIAKRTGDQRATVQDRVAEPRLYKVWNVPGFATADDDYLGLLSDVLTTGKDSRLYRRLVYHDQIATSVEGGVDDREVGGLFELQITAKPGVDLDHVEAIINDEMAKLLRDGPTAEEINRFKTRTVANTVRGAERVGGFGGKSDVLAASQIYTGHPDAWKVSLDRIRNATPAEVLDAGRRWLSDGAFVLDVTPYPDYAANVPAHPTTTVPTPGAPKPPEFPAFTRATLSNGLKVIVAERHTNPTVTFELVLDAGVASDQFAKPGTAALTAASLADGTTTLDALQISDRFMELGATFGVGAGRDSTTVTLSTLTTRIDPALDLFADMVLHPAFRTVDVDREKALRIAAIEQAKREPIQAAIRITPTLAYGPGHPYGVLATEQTVAALNPADLARYHATWFQPAGSTIIVVGDTTLAQIVPKLEARFGRWLPVRTPAKTIGKVDVPSKPVVYLIDKPGALQSVIMTSLIAPPRVNPDELAIEAMNTSLGGAFTSRLNMNLREDKHWAYGAGSFVRQARGPSLFIAYAPVQTDKTAESFGEVRKELRAIVADRPVTAQELDLAQHNLTQSLPGEWETGGAVATSISDIASYGLPDDYWSTYPGRIAALNVADVARAAKTVVRPESLTWVVVGDRQKIEPGLKALGLDLKMVDADAKPVG